MNRNALALLTAIAASLPAAACAEPGQTPAPAAEPEARQFKPTRFSADVRGAGPDVILIPGLTASRDVWAGTVAGVPGYRYHLIQVAGFAGEPVAGNRTGPVAAGVAEEIARYIRAKGLSQPAIVGHSMGGIVAMMVAARHPDRVGKVMAVDILPDPSAGYGASAAALRPLADTLLGALSGTPEGRQTMANLMARYGGPRAANGSDPDVVARATHELATLDLTPELPRIEAPLTILYAADPNGVRTPEQVDRLYQASYRGAERRTLKRIPESGHMIMADQPERFHRELKAFLTAD